MEDTIGRDLVNMRKQQQQSQGVSMMSNTQASFINPSDMQSNDNNALEVDNTEVMVDRQGLPASILFSHSGPGGDNVDSDRFITMNDLTFTNSKEGGVKSDVFLSTKKRTGSSKSTPFAETSTKKSRERIKEQARQFRVGTFATVNSQVHKQPRRLQGVAAGKPANVETKITRPW